MQEGDREETGDGSLSPFGYSICPSDNKYGEGDREPSPVSCGVFIPFLLLFIKQNLKLFVNRSLYKQQMKP